MLSNPLILQETLIIPIGTLITTQYILNKDKRLIKIIYIKI